MPALEQESVSELLRSVGGCTASWATTHTHAILVQLRTMRHGPAQLHRPLCDPTAQVRRRKPAQQAAQPQLRHAVATERDGTATPTASPPATHAT